MTYDVRAARTMDTDDLCRALLRIAHATIERSKGSEGLYPMGTGSRGARLAQRLSAAIARFEGEAPTFGTLDAMAHRDDLSLRGAPDECETGLPEPVGAGGGPGR